MFTNPAPFSKSKKTPKSWEFESYQNDRLFSPFEGEVIDTGSECGGFIKIEHRVKDENVYSKFCGVGRISVLSGNRVRKNEVIGYFGTTPIKLSMVDRRDNSLNIDTFYTESKEKQKDPEKKQKDTGYTPSGSSNDIAKNLLKGLVLSPFIPFHLLSKKKEDEKVNEEINRIKQLLK